MGQPCLLIMYKKDGTEDRFSFDDISLLLSFLESYTREYLIDRNLLELRYDIVLK